MTMPTFVTGLPGAGYPASTLTPVTGTFAATGQSASVAPVTGRAFNVSLWGTFSATIRLERSFDGSNWLPLTANGTVLESFTGACSDQWQEDEVGVQYRLNCTAYTSGTVNYRISQ